MNHVGTNDEAFYLLRQVITICRAKSSIPNHDWHQLKAKIEAWMNNENPNIEPYREIRFATKYRDERASNNIIAESVQLKKDIARLKSFVSVYQKREADMISVLRGSVTNQYKDFLKEQAQN